MDRYDPKNRPDASADFERLCRSIDRTVEQISRAVGTGLGEAGEAIGSAISEAVEKSNAAKAKRASSPVPHSSAQTTTPIVRFERYASPFPAPSRKRFKSSAGLSVSGGIMTALGAMGVLSFGGSALVCATSPTLFAIAGVPATALVAGGVICAVIGGLSAWLTACGIRRMGLASRFNGFKRIFGNREAVSFDELAAQMHRSKKRTIADARKMMHYGLLPQGHIDDECTSLMTTDKSYRLYRQTQREYQRNLAEKQAVRAAKLEQRAKDGALPEAARKFAQEGESYLRRMRELDASISDAAVSTKIESIARVLERMIARVKDEPSTVEALDRLTDYYLPTTVKLLEAYDDLEKQPVQGQNIAGSRNEIEHTLDVLHTAYEKLLDETYRDLSLDVSSDISVLNAVLAQEGLTKSPFDEDPERTDHARNEQ